MVSFFIWQQLTRRVLQYLCQNNTYLNLNLIRKTLQCLPINILQFSAISNHLSCCIEPNNDKKSKKKTDFKSKIQRISTEKKDVFAVKFNQIYRTHDETCKIFLVRYYGFISFCENIHVFFSLLFVCQR